MNLYFRLFSTLIKALFCKKINLLDTTTLRFRVSPLDCDLNLHLTNSRYLAFMDIGRINFIARTKMLGKLLRTGYRPVVADCEISFLKPLNPLQKFHVTTKLLSWDDKYQYFYQTIKHKGNDYATALIKTAFVKKGRVISSQTIIKLIDNNLSVPPLPESVTLLQKLSKAKQSDCR
jgi:acyl-CoA thioesterase FadM